MGQHALLLYVIRRLPALGVLLVALSFLIFSLLYLAPGDPVDILLGFNSRTPETVRALRQEYHLDRSFLEQYWLWAKEAAQLHFGRSIQTSLPVTDEVRARLPMTLFLGLYAYILTMIFGVTLGVAAALRKQRVLDRVITAGTVVGLSTPVFVSGIFLLYVFAILLGWFPVFGRGSGFGDELWHLTLPAIALATHTSAYVAKHTRAAMINVLDQDYIVFARARGLSSRRVLLRYAFRNALIPVITISGIILGGLIAGAVLVEATFSLPGIGSLLIESATAKDLPLLQGVALLIAVVIMVANLLTDLAYMAADPRIRLGRNAA
jgi:peptide/nickel transport system permease protein